MMKNKSKTKSLLCYDELHFNHSIGMPIEVYCPNKKKTIAFGRIEALSENGVIINQRIYSNHHYLFFGLTKRVTSYS